MPFCKRVVAFALGFAFVLTLCACAGAKNEPLSASDGQSDLTVSEGTKQSDPGDTGAATDAAVFDENALKTDKEYQEKMDAATSNAEMTGINEEYAAIWKDRIELYYNKLTEFYSSGGDEFFEYYSPGGNAKMVEIVKNDKAAWEEYYAKEKQNYYEIMYSIYTSGSIMAIVISGHDREICREKAITLYKICLSRQLTGLEPI